MKVSEVFRQYIWLVDLFVFSSMSWYALHLHPGEDNGEQTGGQALSALKV